ncbi:MAG: type II secretion system protein, partial [Alphaproteobacteria bacterium]|nr:type II secretion system protein [Alphaproteobacteria bacterium]
VYKRRTQAKKHRLDVAQFGRSMVEMLGVLAIIGVLSVGAIAGYSKAMFKYKLNKQTEQLSQLLNTLYRHKASWGKNPPSMNLIPFFEALGEIPEDMIKDNSEHIYDVFNYRIDLRTNGCNPLCNEVIIHYYIDDNIDVCLNMINTAKKFSDNLGSMIFAKVTSDNDIAQYTDFYHGNKSCTSNKKCLKDMNMNDIYEQCKFLSDSTRGFIAFLYNISD